MKWAKQQGYVVEDSIEGMEVPGAESRDICITADEFRNLCSYIRDETFLDLCRVTFEIGCRPQEILRIEARHFDSKYSRWVMPVNEAKGKKKPRIIYLTPYALATTEKLVAQFPTGMLFRNTRQKPWTTDAVNCGFDRLRVRMGRSAMKDQGLEMSELMKQALRQDGAPIKDPMKLSQRERDKLSNKIASRYAPQYSLYALRHSWATNALQSGLDALTVAVLMGHSDPSTLSRVYQHLSHNPEHLLKQVEKLSMYQTGTAKPT
jgi:integrase